MCLKSHHGSNRLTIADDLVEKRRQNVIIVGVIARSTRRRGVEIWWIQIREQLQGIYVHVVGK